MLIIIKNKFLKTKAKEEINYLFSRICNHFPSNSLNGEQREKLEDIFKQNRIRLLKQIIINHNDRMTKDITPDLIECILKVLSEYQIIGPNFLLTYFPKYERLIKDPLCKKQKFLKSLENSPVIERSIDSIKYIEDPEKILEISGIKCCFQTEKYDDIQKYEFSSYNLSNMNCDHSIMITRNASNENINSLEARLDHLNFSIMQNNTTVNFKKYIMMSEKDKYNNDNFEVGMKKRKKKKDFWKSSF